MGLKLISFQYGRWFCGWGFLCLILAGPCHASRNLPSLPLTLEDLIQASDIIVKARVTSSSITENNSFPKIRGLAIHADTLQVISVLRGKISKSTITYLHHGPAKPAGPPGGNLPHYFTLKVGNVYILFAQQSQTKGVFLQLWKDYFNKDYKSVLRTANDNPVTQISIPEVIWSELMHLVTSNHDPNVIYAIRQMNEMSGGHYSSLQYFDRYKVLHTIQSFLSSPNLEIVKEAITAMGSDNPYFDEWNHNWLATVGGGRFTHIVKWDINWQNTDARPYWRALAAIAEGKDSHKIRALAIRTLGRLQEPRLWEYLSRWVRDPEPIVRKAATILLADFPSAKAVPLIRKNVQDKSKDVRLGAAIAIGYGQFDSLIPELEKLIQDEDLIVRGSAATCLISFAPDKIRQVLKRNLDHPDFMPLFVNILAETDTETYRDLLAKIIQNRSEPKFYWGGRVPYAQSWDLLFQYLQKQSAKTLRSGAMDKYLHALDNAKFWGSSAPRDLYAWYLKKGIPEHARKFRQLCQKNLVFDMEHFFNRVDREHNSKKNKDEHERKNQK